MSHSMFADRKRKASSHVGNAGIIRMLWLSYTYKVAGEILHDIITPQKPNFALT